METALQVVAALLFVVWILGGRAFARRLWRDYCDGVRVWTIENGETPSARLVEELERRGPTWRQWAVGLWRAGVILWTFLVYPALALWGASVAIRYPSPLVWFLEIAFAVGCVSGIVNLVSRFRNGRRAVVDAAREVFGTTYDHATPDQRATMEDFAVRFGPLSPHSTKPAGDGKPSDDTPTASPSRGAGREGEKNSNVIRV